MSGRKLAAALTTIALLTFVLPPLLARQVNVRRIDRARAGADRLVEVLKAGNVVVLADVAGPSPREPFVLAGSGLAPAFAQGLSWPIARVLSLAAVAESKNGVGPVFAAAAGPAKTGTTSFPTGDAIDDGPDPWGNQFLVVIGVASMKAPAVAGSLPSARTVVVISAGPNGAIETAFASVLIPKGDDIVAVR